MRKKLTITIIVLVLAAAAAGAAWTVKQHRKAAVPRHNTGLPAHPTTNAAKEKPHKLFGNKIVVFINQGIFGPKTVTIKADSAVEWTNIEAANHQIVTDDGKTITAATSPVLGRGQTYDFVFKKAGTYPYHDNLKPDMKGTIKVQ